MLWTTKQYKCLEWLLAKQYIMKTLKEKTESQLKEIFKETVNDVLNRIGMIDEMAVPLRTYRARVDGLRFQLVENWCLCMWCQIFNSECENFALWITELKACINNLKFLDIKNDIDKRRTLIRMLIDDYDYDETNMIVRIINDRFDIENINDNFQRAKVASEFADRIQSLIEVISVDAISTNSYIQNTFFAHRKRLQAST
jgi:hypothetical protein